MDRSEIDRLVEAANALAGAIDNARAIQEIKQTPVAPSTPAEYLQAGAEADIVDAEIDEYWPSEEDEMKLLEQMERGEGPGVDEVLEESQVPADIRDLPITPDAGDIGPPPIRDMDPRDAETIVTDGGEHLSIVPAPEEEQKRTLTSYQKEIREKDKLEQGSTAIKVSTHNKHLLADRPAVVARLKAGIAAYRRYPIQGVVCTSCKSPLFEIPVTFPLTGQRLPYLNIQGIQVKFGICSNCIRIELIYY